MPKFLLLLLFFIILSGCQSPSSTKKKPIQVLPTNPIISAGNLRNATLIEIKNDWNGYSDITPIVRHYKLKPQSDILMGNGYFAVGGYGAYNIRQQYTKKISIPAPITQQFLQKLEETTIQRSSQYQPLINRADDYPAITIHVTTPQRNIVFFSRSQGNHHIPWQIKIQENKQKNDYVSQSAAPDQALLLLKPYIDHPGLEQIINKRQQLQLKHKPIHPKKS